MGLRDVANTDLKSIVEDDTTGFGWPIKVTDPTGAIGNLTGLSNDVGQLIDPDTGVLVSGRFVTIALSINSLIEAGLGLPEGISDSTSKPWIVEFSDINGTPYKFKVKSSMPDRAIGMVTCTLERYV